MSARAWAAVVGLSFAACPPSLQIEGGQCFQGQCPEGFRCEADRCRANVGGGAGGGGVDGGGAGGGSTGGGGGTGGGSVAWENCADRHLPDGSIDWLGLPVGVRDGGFLTFSLPFTPGPVAMGEFANEGRDEFLVVNDAGTGNGGINDGGMNDGGINDGGMNDGGTRASVCLELLRLNGDRLETGGSFPVPLTPTRLAPLRLRAGLDWVVAFDEPNQRLVHVDLSGEVPAFSRTGIIDFATYRRGGQAVDSMVAVTSAGLISYLNDAGTLYPQGTFSNVNKAACAVETGTPWPTVLIGGDDVTAYDSDDAGVTSVNRGLSVSGVRRLVTMERPLDAGHFVGLAGDAGTVLLVGASPGSLTNVQLTIGLTDSLESGATELLGGRFRDDSADLPSLFLSTPAGIARRHFVFTGGDATRAHVTIEVVLPPGGAAHFASGQLTPDGTADLAITQAVPPRLVLLPSE